MKKLLNDMPLFVAKDDSLWKCVNVTNSKAKDPKEALDIIHRYISSAYCHSAIKNSQSRYQAAMILKRSCLQHYAFGDVLQVLHIAIVRKKWLAPHSSGWQPLSLNTTAVSVTTDAIGKA
uniref:OST-HTH associated domain-containing protein n=1 Tax=Arundo donax TaxID=35708 RepID=A0A0A9ABU2_ARUDO